MATMFLLFHWVEQKRSMDFRNPGSQVRRLCNPWLLPFLVPVQSEVLCPCSYVVCQALLLLNTRDDLETSDECCCCCCSCTLRSLP